MANEKTVVWYRPGKPVKAVRVELTLANMQQLSEKLNSNKGSLGLMMNDPSLYNNLNATMISADSLLTNLKAHPKRYVHFSLFGKKDK